MVDSPTNIVLLGSNRNRVGSTGRGRCNRLISPGARIRASIRIMFLLFIVVAPTINLQWDLGSLDPLNTLIPSSRNLEIVRALNHLMLQGKKSLSGYLWLSRTEHRSS
jgi:hypothetical protein